MAKLRLHFLLNIGIILIIRFRIKKTGQGRDIVAINLVEHLGDIVACEPVSRYARDKYPKAYIVWCVRKPYRELIETNSNIDRAIIVHCYTEWIYLIKTNLFDEIIDLNIHGRVCPTCRVPLRKQNGDNNITLDNYYNYGSILSSFSQCAGLPSLDGAPQVYIPSTVDDKIRVYGFPKDYIVIHCLSNELCRNWEIEKWRELLDKIEDELKIAVIEVGLKSLLGEFSNPYYVNLCGKLSILETAEVIRRAALFIGVDSGPAQLANAVGTYGIILLGNYRSFTHYLPYTGKYANGENAEIIYGEGSASAISVDEVFSAVTRKLIGTAKVAKIRQCKQAANQNTSLRGHKMFEAIQK